MSEMPEERAKRICVIAKAVGKGLPRSHTSECGHCGLVIREIRSAVAAERERTLFVWKYVREHLEAVDMIHKLTLLCGDAPSDCNCREAACPHSRQFPPSEDEIIEAIDAAIRKGDDDG